MKIAILGFGVEGRSAFDYWNSPENQITICDQNKETKVPVNAEAKLGPSYLSGLAEFDLIVRSPGLMPELIVEANDSSILGKITTSTNEFFRVSPTKNIIGVTGTKGKGTTSTLIAMLLETAGHTVHLGGNIGKSAIDLLKNNIKPEDYVVLELSSFQLSDIKYSPHISVCLLVVPEHLNWHSSFEEYVAAKRNIFAHQKTTDIAIYYADNKVSRELAQASPGKKIAYFSEEGAYVKDDQFMINKKAIFSTDDIKLIGKHNWQNVCAAVTAYWQVDQNLDVIKHVLTEFEGLEHRLELIRDIDDVRFYNDSFASVPDATIAAVEAIEGQKILIIGGFDRKLSLTNLASSLKKHEDEIVEVVLIGASKSRLAKELKAANFTKYQTSNVQTMSEIVNDCIKIAEPGDSIVLSPGFPSFDMFKNFEERGDKFKEAVDSL